MKTIPINSSSVKDVKHCDQRKCFEITFKNGARYQIDGVSDADVRDVTIAKSVGRHLQFLLKEKPWKRLS